MAIELLAAAFIGGALRAVLGARKYGAWQRLATTMITSGIVGAISAAAFMYIMPVALTSTAALAAAALAGYVGADVIEAFYKIRAARGGSLV